MAIDPRISMQVQQASVAPAINTFMGIREQQRQMQFDPLRMQQMELGNQFTQQQIAQVKQAQEATARQQNISNAAQFYQSHEDLFTQGNPDAIKQAVKFSQLIPDDGKQEIIQAIDSGNLGLVEQSFRGASEFVSQSQKSPQKVFAPVVDPETGNLVVPTVDPNTGEAKTVSLGITQETPQQERKAELDLAGQKKRIELKEKRASDVMKEMGDRNRSATRAQRPLKQALKLIQRADQGITGATKVQLAKLFPGIDVTDEAALSATLNQLALDQLQQFKGPTTDFEFGITQDIAGKLGNSREANEARVKSLDRNNWFNQREFKQYQDHIKSGGHPDNFAFNFGEPVKTKKGVFTLQDLQDTAVDNNLTIEEVLQRLNQ